MSGLLDRFLLTGVLFIMVGCAGLLIGLDWTSAMSMASRSRDSVIVPVASGFLALVGVVIVGHKLTISMNQDVLSGLLFILVGIAGLWIGQDYQMGNAFRMGPGYFPRLLCAMLVLIGAIVAAKGMIAGGEQPEPLHLRPLIMITVAVLAFAVLISTVGLLPAAAAVVFLGMVGGPEFRLGESIVTAVLLTAAAIGIFKYGLSMTMPLLDLPMLGYRI